MLTFSTPITTMADNTNMNNTRYGIATYEEGGYQGDPTFGGPTNVDIVSAPWILQGWGSNHDLWAEKMNLEENKEKSPYITLYVIAGLARQDQDLQDANVVDVNSSQSLANSGANYIRDNREKIIKGYADASKNIGDNFGNKESVYIHLEPDLWQYQYDYQNGGGISFAEAHDLMNRASQAIRNNVPNAKIVMDISPWADKLDSWFSGFNDYDYVGLVGKNFPANESIDGKSYEDMYNLTGKKPFVVNTAHGPGGHFLPYNNTWENDTQGVIHAVIQPPTDNARYASFIETQTGRRMELEPVSNDTSVDTNQDKNSESTAVSGEVSGEVSDDNYKIQVRQLDRSRKVFNITNVGSQKAGIVLFEFKQNDQSKDEYKTNFNVSIEPGQSQEVVLDLAKLGGKDGEQGKQLNEDEGYKLQIGIFTDNWSNTISWFSDAFQTELKGQDRYDQNKVTVIVPVTEEVEGVKEITETDDVPTETGQVTNEYINHIEIDGTKFEVRTIYRKVD